MNQRVLALDTTSEFGSIALVEGGHLAGEILLHSPGGFAHVLYEHLARLLDRHGWRLGDIDAFAAAAGPGAFTGVRVGLAAIKGLAEAMGKPALAVSNLQAVALQGHAPLRAAFLDARRGEVYAALYDERLTLVRPEMVLSFPAWIESLPRGGIEFLSTNLAPFREALAGRASREVPRALAAAIGRLAALRLQAGHAQDPAAIDANYVRRSDAERFWKDNG